MSFAYMEINIEDVFGDLESVMKEKDKRRCNDCW